MIDRAAELRNPGVEAADFQAALAMLKPQLSLVWHPTTMIVASIVEPAISEEGASSRAASCTWQP